MVQKRTVGHRRKLKIGFIIREIKKMLYGARGGRSTALAQLKEVEGADPFRILIGTILSQRTRDENTTAAVNNLFTRFKNAEELGNAEVEDVKALIKPSGFYNMKARNIIRVSKQIVRKFNGKVPNKIDDLLTLPAVGRKTANCVLVYGFGIPAIPVDTHVHRISNRLGIAETKTPEQTETELIKRVQKRYWLELNELFVRFGQTTCKPVRPLCEICKLTRVCRYYREVVLPERRGSLRAE